MTRCGYTLREVGEHILRFARSLLFFGFLAFTSASGLGQARPADFRITKISRNLIATPQYTYSGAQPYAVNQRDRWLEVEVEFATAPDITDELTFKYFVLVNGALLTGEVTHVNILAGRENRSVMYVPPGVLSRVANNRPISPASVQNIAVQLVKQGAIKDELSLTRAPAQWYTAIPPLNGLVLNKDETPFAPLYWDRYAQIKKVGR